VSSASFCPDGTRIVTASADKTVRIWNATTMAPIAVLTGHEAPVASAAYSPDGTRIVALRTTPPRSCGMPRLADKSQYCAAIRTSSIQPRSIPTARAMNLAHGL
jgi:WD40 repeat protein